MDLNRLVNEYQTIKIVPSIEDILRSSGFNTSLDESTEIWFNQILCTWLTWKKSFAVHNQIETIFTTSPQPFSTALCLVIKCDDFKDCKPKTLPFCIIEELGKWANKSNRTPEDSAKLPAFQIATQQRNQLFLTLVLKTYNVKTKNDLILPLVQEMINCGNHKQALQSIISLEMFDDIPVQDLLFPLVLQDKTSMVDQYLTQCPGQARPFVLYLDQLLDKNRSIKDLLHVYIEENKISDVKWDKLHYKPLGKLVARLCTKYNILINECKNLSKYRTTGGLRYLIYQKYQERNVSASAWDDLVKDSLKQNPESAFEFIDMLAEFDRKEALKWAEFLKIPKSNYPLILNDVNAEESEARPENWDIEPGPSQEYYKLSLIDTQIVIIDSSEKFYDCLSNGFRDCSFVGLDCEWKPSFGATQSRVALIQVATCNGVYLIDATILNNQDYASFWTMFSKKLLEDVEIIKIGFGLENDLKEMQHTVTGLNNIRLKGEGLLDLAKLWKSLSNSGLKFPYSSDNSGASLSCLVECCFGLPLKKQEQCSNWEIRPLRNTQIEYAALDAYVLVEIYLKLQNLCLSQNIKFDEICGNIMVEGKQKSAKKPKEKVKAIQLPSMVNSKSGKPLLVHQVKFYVEPKLSKLTSYLRYCGLDTEIVSCHMLWHEVINLAISEERLILVNKLKCTPTVNYPQESILEVSNTDICEQIFQILNHYRIVVTKDNLFSRCLFCNNVELSIVPHDSIRNMFLDYKNSKSRAVYRNNSEYYSNDLNPDDFLSDSDSEEDLFQHVKVDYKPRETSSCLTKNGVTIQMEEVTDSLIESNKLITLCNSCGKLYWEGESLLTNIDELVKNVILSK